MVVQRGYLFWDTRGQRVLGFKIRTFQLGTSLKYMSQGDSISTTEINTQCAPQAFSLEQELAFATRFLQSLHTFVVRLPPSASLVALLLTNTSYKSQCHTESRNRASLEKLLSPARGVSHQLLH